MTLVMLGAIAASLPPQAFADDFQARMQEHRRRFEERKAEFDRKFQARTGTSPSQQRTTTYGTNSGHGTTTTYGTTGTHGSTGTYGSTGTHGSTGTYGSSGTHGSFGTTGTSKVPSYDPKENMKGTDFNPLPFDAKKAPTPDLCLLKFAQAAKTATRIEDLMPYIPYAQLNSLKGYQKTYDPALAAQRKAEYEAKGMDADGVRHLTSSPYDNELRRLKSLGDKIMRVKSFKYTASNKAKLDVATHNCQAEQNGGKYPYGTADVEMRGEDNYWRMESYNDGNAFYQSPQ